MIIYESLLTFSFYFFKEDNNHAYKFISGSKVLIVYIYVCVCVVELVFDLVSHV